MTLCRALAFGKRKKETLVHNKRNSPWDDLDRSSPFILLSLRSFRVGVLMGRAGPIEAYLSLAHL